MVIAQQISGTGSWTYNLTTDQIWGSAEALRLFGYPEVARVFPIAEIEACIPERDRVHLALVALIEQGQDYDMEFAIKPVDGGDARIVHSVAKLETDLQGKPLIVLGFVQDITKARQMDEQVRQLAFFDPLTALPNRRLLLDRLSQALGAAQRSSCYGALMFLDLDNFKPLNDMHGHEAGDLLLVEVARRLNKCVRGMDTVARLGGDEFVVLIGGLTVDPVESKALAGKVAEKIRLALAKPYLLASKTQPAASIEHHCSASIGLVLFSKLDQNQEEILRWADAAMYHAKDAGRNRVRFHAGGLERAQPPTPGEPT
jgi:diguanylate cyclase (GGDEF)-like protein